jgi:hypothetical protein
MTPESRNNPLLGNGLLTHGCYGNDTHLHNNEWTRNRPVLDNGSVSFPVTTDTQNTTDELFKLVFCLPSVRSYKRTFNRFVEVSQIAVVNGKSFVLKSSGFIRELGVQLWRVNQWTTEAEEVIDS